MEKLTRYEIEYVVNAIMSDYEYGDCYPDEVLELEEDEEIALTEEDEEVVTVEE